MLDKATCVAIYEAGGEFQISVWPRRSRNGAMYLRVHIEPPYQGSEDADLSAEEFVGNEPAATPAPAEDLPWS